MQAAITVSHLTKEYGEVTAVNDISFTVPTGSTFAFLGTNGAGKSSTIGCLTTINSITLGEVTINGLIVGRDDGNIRKTIGVVFQSSILDPLLTARENLQSRARFYQLGTHTKSRIAELSDLIDLGDFLDTRYGTLSGGQKRRVDIARALLHRPSILFLDDPTAGLDPQSREKVWQAVDGLQNSANLTVFLTTHYMEETERATTAYIIDHGSIIAHGSPTELRARYSQDELRITTTNISLLASELESAKYYFTNTGHDFNIRVSSSIVALKLLQQHKAHISDFEFQHGTMDDVFLKLTEAPSTHRSESFKT